MNDDLSLLAAVRATACRFPGKPALVSPERDVSYGELCANIDALASHLRQSGLQSGDRVALLDIDSTEYLELFYALGAAGLIVVPLNYRQRVEELAFQLGDSGTRLLIAGSRYASEAETLGSAIDLGWKPLAEFHDEALASSSQDSVAEGSVESREPFAICYTSGTTGRPKGATISQHAVTLRALKFVAEFGLISEDVVHVIPPLFHISGVVLNLMGLLRGCTVLIMPQFKFEDTMAAMRRHRVSFVCLVPTILAMMAGSKDFCCDIFGSLRILMYAGSPMNPKLLRDVMAVYQGEVVQSFGQTEDLPQLILNARDHRAAYEAGAPALHSVGRPAIGVEIKICDRAGRPVPAGVIGEIASRGGTGMIEYWNMPEATASTVRDGWVHSGDLGYVGEDGFVYLAGREKQMIIRGGENVYPAEVEKVLLEAPGVKDAVVLGLPHPVWGEVVVAVAVADECAADEAALITFCKARLASYRCPERIVFREALAYNAGGKVDRARLREEFGSSSS